MRVDGPGDDSDRRTSGSERDRGGRADAAARAGDEDAPPGESAVRHG
jgi:hypothetical protein